MAMDKKVEATVDFIVVLFKETKWQSRLYCWGLRLALFGCV